MTRIKVIDNNKQIVTSNKTSFKIDVSNCSKYNLNRLFNTLQSIADKSHIDSLFDTNGTCNPKIILDKHSLILDLGNNSKIKTYSLYITTKYLNTII